jgi:hypothetical protein
MKPEKQQLIHELLVDDGHSEHTLLAAARILRHRRQWRAARQSVALIALLAAAVWLIGQKTQLPVAARTSPNEATLPVAKVAQSLTDAELLELFPNTPVALATLPNGKKLLIFPRSADQAKYIKRI